MAMVYEANKMANVHMNILVIEDKELISEFL